MSGAAQTQPPGLDAARLRPDRGLRGMRPAVRQRVPASRRDASHHRPLRPRDVARVIGGALLPGSGFRADERSPARGPAVPGRHRRGSRFRRGPGGGYLPFRFAAVHRGQPAGTAGDRRHDQGRAVPGDVGRHRPGRLLHRRQSGGRPGPATAGTRFRGHTVGLGPGAASGLRAAAAGRDLGPRAEPGRCQPRPGPGDGRGARRDRRENQPIGALQREFGYDPGTVASHGLAFIKGMQQAEWPRPPSTSPGWGGCSATPISPPTSSTP